MANLQFQTEQGTSVAQTLLGSAGQINEALTALNSSVGQLQQSWRADGANQFQNEYSQWRTSLSSAIEALNNLKTRLDAEIAEWEATASKS